MKKLRFAFLGLILAGLFNCNTVDQPKGRTGYIVTSVEFPAKSFTVKTIPESTDKILVRINGRGIPPESPISYELTPEDTKSVVGEVPEGNKTVKAVAMDVNGNIVAVGESSVNVIPLMLNKVKVVMGKTNVTATPEPSQVPSCQPQPSPTPIIIDKECKITIRREDLIYFRSGKIEESIRNSGCLIEIPGESPSPTVIPSVTPTSSPTPGRGGGSTGGGGGTNNNNGTPVNSTLNVIDGPPVDIISVTTPGP
jgi:hypothetical protein